MVVTLTYGNRRLTVFRITVNILTHTVKSLAVKEYLGALVNCLRIILRSNNILVE